MAHRPSSNSRKSAPHGAATNLNKIVHECRATSGCIGTCPLKVIVHRSQTSEPASCKICGEQYVVPVWAKTLFGNPTSYGGSTKATDGKVARLEKEKADLQKQLKAAKAGQGSELDAKDGKPKPSIAELQQILDLANKIGSTEMAKIAQADLDEARKADKSHGVTNTLDAVFAKLERDKKRRDQAAANVLHAQEKLAVLEATALEAAKQFIITEIEKDRLLLLDGHVVKPPQPPPCAASRINLPAPSSLNDEQKEAWLKVVAMANAKATADAKAELAKAFPDAILESEETADQGPAKKGKVGEKGTSAGIDLGPAIAAGMAENARIEREAKLKQDDLDGNFKRALATNSDPANAMAYEGATPLDGKDSDFEATPPGPTPEEIHALSVKALAESIARAQKERETKKADDAKLGGFDFA
jgi:hypothetical protein